jgi:uncharacterized protein YcnI
VVSAHVAVEPKSIGVGTFTTFVVSIPNEKETPTIGVRIVLPEGLKEVSAFAKAGWKVTTKKIGDGETAKVTELSWVDGSIEKDLRDEFKFSAQVPPNPTALAWKTYQTYQDGSVVSWDQAPKDGSNDANGDAGPYAISQVVNDLPKTADTSKNNDGTLISVAIFLASLALFMNIRTRIESHHNLKK